MQRYDVALWLTPFSWWPDDVAFVDAEAASLAVVQLNKTPPPEWPARRQLRI
jgi:hypothetical protein